MDPERENKSTIMSDIKIVDKCEQSFAILGAGSIGCYLGAHLIKAGYPVQLIGRQRLQAELQQNGMQITSLNASTFHLRPEEISYQLDPAFIQEARCILVCVKSMQTKEIAGLISKHARRDAMVVSFQNGLHNAQTLRAGCGDRRVLAGMIPFNVVQQGAGHFHNGTSGKLLIEQKEHASQIICKFLNEAGLPISDHKDLPGVLRGKLLFNLNNALNALAGIPLRQELQNRNYRKILAAAIREGRLVFRSAHLSVKSMGRMIPALAPMILCLPDFLFFRIAANMIKIDPQARSSMWEDLKYGRKTEIDYLNVEIVKLADFLKLEAPINRALVYLIGLRENKQLDKDMMQPEEILSYVSKKK